MQKKVITPPLIIWSHAGSADLGCYQLVVFRRNIWYERKTIPLVCNFFSGDLAILSETFHVFKPQIVPLDT